MLPMDTQIVLVLVALVVTVIVVGTIRGAKKAQKHHKK